MYTLDNHPYRFKMNEKDGEHEEGRKMMMYRVCGTRLSYNQEKSSELISKIGVGPTLMLLLLKKLIWLLLLIAVWNLPIVIFYSESNDLWALKNLESGVGNANYVECATSGEPQAI